MVARMARVRAPNRRSRLSDQFQPDYVICLEDGRRFKSLKRHLSLHGSVTPQDYRERWGLPADYPMVAPKYAKARSRLAKRSGLAASGHRVDLILPRDQR